MKIIKNLVLLSATTFLFNSCNKYPRASFTTDNKEIYYAGETIALHNTSKDSKTYSWDFSDGTSSKKENTSYIIPENVKDRDVIITFTAYSARGKRSSTIHKTIPVSQAISENDKYSSSNSLFTFYQKLSGTDDKGYWINIYSKPEGNYSTRLNLNFFGGRPAPGSYIIYKDVSFKIEYLFEDDPVNYLFVSGGNTIVNVTSLPNNKLLASFSNIKLKPNYSGSNIPDEKVISSLSFSF